MTDLYKTCAQRLERELDKTPITTTKQAFRVVEALAWCFLAYAKDVSRLYLEIYGNGNPDGMLSKIVNIEREITVLHKLLDNSDQRKTLSDKIVFWFVEKVLPALVTQIIIAVVILLATMWAFQLGMLP